MKQRETSLTPREILAVSGRVFYTKGKFSVAQHQIPAARRENALAG